MIALLLAGILSTRIARIEPPTSCHDDGRVPIAESTKISEPGHYYLIRDITTESGPGITVGALNVRLDLNGHTITVPASDAAIVIEPVRGNSIEIVNGRLEGGRGVSMLEAVFGGPKSVLLRDLEIRFAIEGVHLQWSDPSRFPPFTPKVEIESSRIVWNGEGSGLGVIGVITASAPTPHKTRILNSTIEAPTAIRIHHPQACEVKENGLKGVIRLTQPEGLNIVERNIVQGQISVVAEQRFGNVRIVENTISGGISVGVSNSLIANNLVTGASGAGVEIFDAFPWPTERVTVIGNQLHGNGGCGIKFLSGHDHVYQNNNVRGNGISGIAGECGGSLGTNLDAGGNIL